MPRKMKPVVPHIRWVIRRDMQEVMAIDASNNYAWSEDEFLRVLRQRNAIGMVAEWEEKIVGFMIYELHKFKLHVLHFCIHPDYRRRGIGLAMSQKLVSKLSSHRRVQITANVRERDLSVQMFLRSQGFKASLVVRSFFEDSGEDAFRMEYSLADEPEICNTVNRIAMYEDH